MKIRPIKPRRISSQVFEQVRELIYKGVFKAGEQIPTERELASSMQVSRTSIRNAIDKLVNLGLLNQIQGRGTFVVSPETREGNPLAVAMDSSDASSFDLLEMRMGFECNAAKLAATRATTSDLENIRDILDEMEQDLADNREISTNTDTAFHMAVTFSTKNPVLIHVTRNFYDFLFSGIKKSLMHMRADEFAYQEILAHHHSIFYHIKERDPQKAHDAMRSHLLYVQNFFVQHHATLGRIEAKQMVG